MKLVYLAGSGRSGSTLMARLLGSVPELENLGEACRCLFNDRMLARAGVCGCGENLAGCPFWREIVGEVDPAARAYATRRVKMRRFRGLARVDPRDGEGEMAHLLDQLGAMLDRCRRRSGREILVDASSNPATGLLLSRVPGVELHVVHLVRDPRGVVSSWTRRKGYLARHSTLRIALWWRLANTLSERLGGPAASYARVRYEDATAAIRPALETILRGVGAGGADLGFLEGGRARLTPQHPVAGNPEPMPERGLEIVARGWSLGPGKRLLTTLLTWPLLRRYGYR